MVGGARVLLQDFNEGAALFRGQFVQLLGWLYVHFDLADGLGEASCGFGVGVRVRQVRLDIDDGCSVHQIGTGDDDFGPFRPVDINALNLYARKRDRVRAKARSGRENAETLIAAQSRWAHGRAPGATNVFRKNPHDPQVAKTFEPAKRVCIAELRLKANDCLQVLHQTALSRNAKLFAKVAVDSCDNFKRDILHDCSHSWLE